MEATTPDLKLSEKISTGRVLRAGLLAASFSGVANALVLLVASALFGSIAVPPGEPLTLGPVVVASAVGAVGAAIALAVMGRLVRRPMRVFRIIAVVVLLLSFLPIVLLGVAGPSAGALILMHVVSAAIVVGLLTSPVRGRQRRGEAAVAPGGRCDRVVH